MKTVIISIIKNEHLYLDEWIQYHLKLGFNHIYLLEDFDSESHQDIVNKYTDKVTLYRLKDITTKEEMSGKNRQVWGFNWFIHQNYRFKSDIDWCLFIDIDEFIELENCSLNSLVEKYNNYPGFNLYWKCYNANGHIYRDPSKSTEELYKSKTSIIDGPKKKYAVKCFVNMQYPEEYKFHSVHIYPYCIDPNFTYSDKSKRIYNGAWINHYFTKSAEDWALRLERGNMTKGIRRWERFFNMNKDLNFIKEQNLFDCAVSDKNKFIELNNINNNIKYKKVCVDISDFKQIKNIINSMDPSKYSHYVIMGENFSIQLKKNYNEMIFNMLSKNDSSILFLGFDPNYDVKKFEKKYGIKFKNGVFLSESMSYDIMGDNTFDYYGFIIPTKYKSDLLDSFKIIDKYQYHYDMTLKKYIDSKQWIKLSCILSCINMTVPVPCIFDINNFGYQQLIKNISSNYNILCTGTIPKNKM